VVDDEATVHEATAFALEGLTVLGQPLAFLHAFDEDHARDILDQRDDIAVILLDVVMEREDSGLRLVRHVRETLGLRAVRIIRHTGQPGYAPEMEVIQAYDINDYKMKSALARARLATTMVTAIRSYQQIRTIESGQRTLENIVSGAAELFARRGLANFCDALLLNASRLPGGIVSGLVALPGHARIEAGRDATLHV
jgi:CheY-like chemotaxis protein